MLRSAMFACAAAMMAMSAAPSFAETPAQGRCEAMTFRLYFSRGEARLTDAAAEMLAAAERSVAGCDYAELRMTMDAASPQARERRDAIMAASAGRDWDAVRVEWSMLQRTSARTGAPEYVQVTMTPEPMTAPMEMAEAETGV